MKIKMKTVSAGPDGYWPIGKVLEVGKDVDKKEAKALLDGSYAEVVVEPEAPPEE
jgi:hypothetical protein